MKINSFNKSYLKIFKKIFKIKEVKIYEYE